MNISRRRTIESYNKAFNAAREKLNDKQKEAVNEIYGPVMTVAGPGTGKTQLLAVRIGNILQKTDINTNNILCLTYTDAGSMAMRDRLKTFIGPEAYNATIFTFHSFCNYVIQENIQYFGGFRNLQLISDLELVDVYREIIDGFHEDHPLKRLKGNLYFESDRLKNLFNIMKQEGWTADTIANRVQSLRTYYNEQDETGNFKHPKFLCKAKQTGKLTGKVYTKGEINQDKIELEIQSFEGLIAAAKELSTYDAILKRMERYDYNDMILWVINAFKNNEDLLATYQERFQFILVDEYQDTNGAQNELLFLLADNPVDDRPNVFIVGDDDQSIYRFQGANMRNILEFADKYHPVEIVLDNNYRSDQRILDRAKLLIENNKERLVNIRSHLTKELTQSTTLDNKAAEAIRINRYKSIAQEEIGVISDILKKNKEGVPFHEMAVIYRKHKNVENIVKYLTLLGIPLNIKRKVNVLKQQDVKKLLLILRYITEEFSKPFSGEKYLFEILHFDYFGIGAQDVALISLYCGRRTDDNENDKKWRSVISDVKSLKEAGVRDVEKVIKCSDALESWIQDIPNVTAQILFERILTKGNVLDSVLESEDKVWKLQLINTFFNFIKEESSKQEDITMPQLLEMVDKMEENRIEMPLTKIIFSEKGINFLTAHGSKGLEFEYVYIIRTDSQNWIKKNANRGSYKYPATLVPASEQNDVEDDRRLFYVAMTRAKSQLIFSYSQFDDKEKELEPVRFIAEITVENENEIKTVEVPEATVLEYQADLMRFSQGKPQLIEKDLIDSVLQSFRISATSLNKYLRCPITFYFENILRVPMARSMANGFGNAIHYALELYFRELEDHPDRIPPSVEKLHQYFQNGMKKFHSHFTKKERELSELRGRKLLNDYFEEYHKRWSAPRKYELEFDIKTEYNGVPISGKLDKISIYDDHLEVVDYKTGRYDSSKLKGPVGDDDLGGDYWRQMVFYRLLLEGEDRLSKPMRSGVMDFVEKTNDKFNRKKFEIEPFEMDVVGQQLMETYEKIKQHEFTKGCEEEGCKWCNFVNESMPVTDLIFDEEEQ